MKFYSLFLICLLLSFINTKKNIKEIEYRQKVISKYTKTFTFISIKFNKESGIVAQYQTGLDKFEIDPETLEIIDKNGDEGLKTFELTNEELGLKPNKELFKNFDKIEFPEETDYINSVFWDFPQWHLIVDGKDYKFNVNPDFYIQFNDLVNIKNIKDYVIKLYNK